MKEIQQLIAAGQTKEALHLLVQTNGDALLLQAQYNNGEKQFNLGLIDFSEWQRIQARVNFAALEMAGRAASSSPSGATGGGHTATPATTPQVNKPSVFISYNHNDAFAMRAVKAYLEDHGIEAFVDFQDMAVGEKIEEFIDKAFRDNKVILSIISPNSLKSGWVNKELAQALALNGYGSKWVPVLLDKYCFETKFFSETMDELDTKMKELKTNISKELKKGRDIRAFTDELSRLEDLRSGFGKTIQTLKSRLVEDISGNLFDHGMSRAVKAIKG